MQGIPLFAPLLRHVGIFHRAKLLSITFEVFEYTPENPNAPKIRLTVYVLSCSLISLKEFLNIGDTRILWD